jgi:hypothetical protein
MYAGTGSPTARCVPAPSGTTARRDFDWADGAERVNVAFVATGEAKGQVAIEHARLPSEHAAAEAKAFWRARLAALKTHLES